MTIALDEKELWDLIVIVYNAKKHPINNACFDPLYLKLREMRDLQIRNEGQSNDNA